MEGNSINLGSVPTGEKGVKKASANSSKYDSLRVDDRALGILDCIQRHLNCAFPYCKKCLRLKLIHA